MTVCDDVVVPISDELRRVGRSIGPVSAAVYLKPDTVGCALAIVRGITGSFGFAIESTGLQARSWSVVTVRVRRVQMLGSGVGVERGRR